MAKKYHFNDPPLLPKTGEAPETVYNRAAPLKNSPGADYVERRHICPVIAAREGIRYLDDFAGRPAILAPLRNHQGHLTGLHGRYLSTVRGQNKMCTIGTGNGVIQIAATTPKDPLVLVEGLFDALSLAMCNWSSTALIGREVNWLPSHTADRTVWLAFDACRQAELDAERYRSKLHATRIHRILPPPNCKDWNTALKKRGPQPLSRWLQQQNEAHA